MKHFLIVAAGVYIGSQVLFPLVQNTGLDFAQQGGFMQTAVWCGTVAGGVVLLGKVLHS